MASPWYMIFSILGSRLGEISYEALTNAIGNIETNAGGTWHFSPHTTSEGIPFGPILAEWDMSFCIFLGPGPEPRPQMALGVP